MLTSQLQSHNGKTVPLAWVGTALLCLAAKLWGGPVAKAPDNVRLQVIFHVSLQQHTDTTLWFT